MARVAMGVDQNAHQILFGRRNFGFPSVDEFGEAPPSLNESVILGALGLDKKLRAHRYLTKLQNETRANWRCIFDMVTEKIPHRHGCGCNDEDII